MSIYPGNSGGPVVEDVRLVGIVSAQATLPSEDPQRPSLLTRISFGKVIKARHLHDLLAAQIRRMRRDVLKDVMLSINFEVQH